MKPLQYFLSLYIHHTGPGGMDQGMRPGFGGMEQGM